MTDEHAEAARRPQQPRRPDRPRPAARGAAPPGSRGQVVVGRAARACSGFAAVTQVQANEQDDTYAGLREQDLIECSTASPATSQRAETEIAGLEQHPRRPRSRAPQRAQAALDAGPAAGRHARHPRRHWCRSTGPGIRVTVTDDRRRPVEHRHRCSTCSRSCAPPAPRRCEINDKVRVVAQTSLEDAAGGIARRRRRC